MKGLFSSLAALGLILSPGWAKADYDFATFDVPGAMQTFVYGINSSGQIVGTYRLSSGENHGFILDVDGSYTTIDVPGAPNSYAIGINDAGQIVGTYRNPGGHGFLLDVDGSFTAIDVPGAGQTFARGINNAGQIAGSYAVGGALHGFVQEADG